MKYFKGNPGRTSNLYPELLGKKHPTYFPHWKTTFY